MNRYTEHKHVGITTLIAIFSSFHLNVLPALALLEMIFHSLSSPMHASINLNKPAFCGKASSGR